MSDGLSEIALESNRPKATLRYCDDCGRRFFNLGWHAEACGSDNFYELLPSGLYRVSINDTESANGHTNDA